MEKSKICVILSYRASNDLVVFLKNLGINVIKSKAINVDKNIDDHPDLQVFKVNDRKIIVAPSTYDYYKNRLEDYKIEVLSGEMEPLKKYPNEVIYNISKVSNYYFGKKGFIDPVIKREMEDQFYEEINVKQGYARCSSLEISENTLITSDNGIYYTFKKLGVDVHLFTQKGIILRGYDEAFLGGTCGMIGYDKIVFTGNIEKYPDYEKLSNILINNNIDMIYPRSLELKDLGGLIFLGGDSE